MGTGARWLWVCLTGLVATAGCARRATEATAPPGAFMHEIPFETVANYVVVPVRLGDDPAVRRFIVDTAAFSSFVMPDLAAEAGLSPRSAVDARGFTEAGATIGFDTVATVAVGPVVFRQVGVGILPATSADALHHVACQRFDGILGHNVLRRMAVEFDFETDVLRLASDPSRLPVRAGGRATRLRGTVHRVPRVRVRLGSMRRQALIDTAAPTVIVTLDDAEALAQAGPLAAVRGHGAIHGAFAARETDVVWFRAPTRIGNGPTLPMAVEAIDGDGTRVIGRTWLEAFVVRIDYPGRTLWTYPIAQRRPPRDIDSLGFGWDYAPGKAWVTRVFPTVATQVEIGDQILAIDGRRVADMSAAELCRTRWKSPEAAKFELGRGSGRVTVTLHARPLIGPTF